MTTPITATFWTVLMIAGIGGSAPSETSQPSPDVTPVASTTDVLLKPRFVVEIPSARTLLSETQRSHAGAFTAYFANWVKAIASESSEGINPEQASKISEEIKNWPDTSIVIHLYAPDTQSRQCVCFGLDWPITELRSRLNTVLNKTGNTDQNIFSGLTLAEENDGSLTLQLDAKALGYLIPTGTNKTYFTTHRELPVPQSTTPSADGDTPPLIRCQLNLTGTEKDSGETVFSSFKAVTQVDYAGNVTESGDWQESIVVHWPPISGVGAKVIFDRVKLSYYVPEEAFGSFVLGSLTAHATLENAAGFYEAISYQNNDDDADTTEETSSSPISENTRDEICLTVLPGKGFLPAPDVVIQMRTNKRNSIVEDLRTCMGKINASYLQRDLAAPWHEFTRRERPVFYRRPNTAGSGIMFPIMYRPVLFVTRELDASQKEREFLVMAWTSAFPEDFVDRWLDFPRGDKSKYMPKEEKTDGQAWINWSTVYTWISPYINLSLGSTSDARLLPAKEEIQEHLTDAVVTAKMKYEGMEVSHSGPVPTGPLIMSTLLGIASAEDVSGGSDLARERLACQRLKVLYHHSKLFQKDMGRWPAEVAELDGYVDFKSHSYLLKLKASSKKQWLSALEHMFTASDDEDQDEESDEFEDDQIFDVNDDLYVIDWHTQDWKLGFAPDTFEHIKDLYIDHDGQIHRILNPAPPKSEESETTVKNTVEEPAETPKELPEQNPEQTEEDALKHEEPGDLNPENRPVEGEPQ